MVGHVMSSQPKNSKSSKYEIQALSLRNLSYFLSFLFFFETNHFHFLTVDHHPADPAVINILKQVFIINNIPCEGPG